MVMYCEFMVARFTRLLGLMVVYCELMIARVMVAYGYVL